MKKNPFVVLLVLAFVPFFIMFLPGFKHNASSYYYDSSSGYISNENFRFSIYQTIFGAQGYSYGPDLKGFFPLILGFILLVLFIILLTISLAMASGGNSATGLEVVKLVTMAGATFFLCPIFSIIALVRYNDAVNFNSLYDNSDGYGQGFEVRYTFWYVLLFLYLLAMLGLEIYSFVTYMKNRNSY